MPKTAPKTKDRTELAALSALLGVMSTAAHISEQLLMLSDDVMGRSVDALMKKAGISISELEAQAFRAPKRRRARKSPSRKPARKSQKRA
jgi:hypothetical protein